MCVMKAHARARRSARETRLAFVGCIGAPRRRAVRRLAMPANRRLPCNCDSRTAIIIIFGLSSAATVCARVYARRRRRRRRRRRPRRGELSESGPAEITRSLRAERRLAREGGEGARGSHQSRIVPRFYNQAKERCGGIIIGRYVIADVKGIRAWEPGTRIRDTLNSVTLMRRLSAVEPCRSSSYRRKSG